ATTEDLTRSGLQPSQRRVNRGTESGREAAGFEVGTAEGGRNGESRRNRDAEVGHFGEPGAFAAEHVFHRRGPVGATLAEEENQRLGTPAGHGFAPASETSSRLRGRLPLTAMG